MKNYYTNRHNTCANRSNHKCHFLPRSARQTIGRSTIHHYTPIYDNYSTHLYVYAIQNLRQHSRNAPPFSRKSDSTHLLPLGHEPSNPWLSYPKYSPSANDSQAHHFPRLSCNSTGPAHNKTPHPEDFYSCYVSARTGNPYSFAILPK